MARISLNQVIHDIKEGYLRGSKDKEKVTYGNIALKVEEACGGGYAKIKVSATVPEGVTIDDSNTQIIVHD